MPRTGRPKVDSEAITLRLTRRVLQGIDDLRRAEPDIPTRQDMIRRIVEAALAEKATASESYKSDKADVEPARVGKTDMAQT